MRSALALVAFSQGCEMTGIVALLRTALDALDRSEHPATAVHLEIALTLLRDRIASQQIDEFRSVHPFE